MGQCQPSASGPIAVTLLDEHDYQSVQQGNRAEDDAVSYFESDA